MGKEEGYERHTNQWKMGVCSDVSPERVDICAPKHNKGARVERVKVGRCSCIACRQSTSVRQIQQACMANCAALSVQTDKQQQAGRCAHAASLAQHAVPTSSPDALVARWPLITSGASQRCGVVQSGRHGAAEPCAAAGAGHGASPGTHVARASPTAVGKAAAPCATHWVHRCQAA